MKVCHSCQRVIDGYEVPTNDGREECPWCGEDATESPDEENELQSWWQQQDQDDNWINQQIEE